MDLTISEQVELALFNLKITDYKTWLLCTDIVFCTKDKYNEFVREQGYEFIKRANHYLRIKFTGNKRYYYISYVDDKSNYVPHHLGEIYTDTIINNNNFMIFSNFPPRVR